MTPLPRPSVSPLYSFCTTRPYPVRRYEPFSETLQAIWRAVSGRPKKTFRERVLEAAQFERLAEELDAEPEGENESHRNESHDRRTG
jgi:hypothetical protein